MRKLEASNRPLEHENVGHTKGWDGSGQTAWKKKTRKTDPANGTGSTPQKIHVPGLKKSGIKIDSREKGVF